MVTYCPGTYPVRIHGPYPTTGNVAGLNVFRSCTWLFQMCSGTTGMGVSGTSTWGFLVVMTTVPGPGAETDAKLAHNDPLAVAAAGSVMMRRYVQSTSAAVIGTPSVQRSPRRSLNVQVRASRETVHPVAR